MGADDDMEDDEVEDLEEGQAAPLSRHVKVRKNVPFFVVLRNRIRDPVLFLAPGSGIRIRDPDPGSGINISDHFSESLEKQFCGLKILKLFDADPGIRDLFDPGSGFENL